MSTVRPFRFVLIACLCALSPATADPPEPNWDQLKETVDNHGRVKSSGVKAPAFRSAMGVRWQILQPGETGEARPVHLLDTFRTGDRYRLKVESLTDATVYLLRQKPDGSWEYTDEPNKGVWAVKAGKAVELPSATDWFTFDDTGGQDGRSRIRLLCTVQPLPAADTRRLGPLVERLAGDKEVDAGDRPLKSRYTPVDGKGNALAVEKGGPKASPPSKSPDDKDPGLVLVRQVGDGRWHAAVLADGRAEADWLLAHDIALDHTKGGKAVGGGFDPKRVYALLIGVQEYEYCQKLNYTCRDATKVAHFLASLGVPAENIVLLRDDDPDPKRRPTAKNIRAATDAFFRRRFEKDCSVWFYFSGHGLHDPATGTSYLLPRDPPTFPNDPQKKFSLAELLRHSISVTDVKERLSNVPDARLRLMFIDACRKDGTDQNLKKATDASLQTALGGKDLLVYSSCEASQVSLEDPRHQHGVFTCQLLDGLRGLGVSSVAHPDQWVNSVSLHDKLILGTRQQLASYHFSAGENPAERPTDQRPTLLYPRELGAMNLCPATAFRNSAGMALLRLRDGDGVFGSPATEPGRNGRLEYEQQTLQMKWPPKDGQGPRLVYMGQSEVTQGQYAEVTGERPSRFHPDGPGKEFVTTEAKGGKNLPRRPDQMPVESVSWYEANDFCDKLTKRENEKLTGAGYRVWYRLPTEEEWEYACRAGTRGPFGVERPGDGQAADPDLLWGEVFEYTDRKTKLPVEWRGYVCSAVFDPSDQCELYSKAAREFDAKNPDRLLKPRVRPEPVGEGRVEFEDPNYQLAANDWGFHDMHGNVAEWTATRYDPADRPPKKLTAPRPPLTSNERVTAGDWLVIRGGSWAQPAAECRSASRSFSKPKPVSGGAGDGHRIGFRVVCEVVYP